MWRTVLVLCAMVVGCSDSRSSGTGGGGEQPVGGAGAGGADGGGGAAGPLDPEQCPLQESEEDCVALGCLYVEAVRFAELVCEGGIETSACTWWKGENILGTAAWRRDDEAGRLVFATGFIPGVGPVGFTQCGFSGDYCECFE